VTHSHLQGTGCNTSQWWGTLAVVVQAMAYRSSHNTATKSSDSTKSSWLIYQTDRKKTPLKAPHNMKKAGLLVVFF
jgi:hypothetical protein